MTAQDLSDLFAPDAGGPQIADVLLPVALDRAYSYAIPPGMAVEPGTIVGVQLGPRAVVGVVWSLSGKPDAAVKRLRPIERAFDCPPLREAMRHFVDRVAAYTLTPRGMVLRMVLRSPEALEEEAPMRGLVLDGPEPVRLTDARKRLLDMMRESGGLAWTRSGLAEQAGVSPGVVDGLVAAGTLREVPISPYVRGPDPDPAFTALRLTEAQASASAALVAGIGKGYATTLLEGVTGAGKTDVYLEAVAECVRQGLQALVLVPEIALTQSFLERFAQRFGALPAEWHSDVSVKARARTWRGTALGDVKVVTGARSALYLPFRALGLIVVDEEHDQAYKQEEWASYSARDMAVLRARLENIPVLLASATPSLETRLNAEWGRYGRLHLPARATGQSMPEIEAIDMKAEGPERGKFIAPKLVAGIEAANERGEQALLFLNRRGYAPLTLCRSCGHRFQCPNCSTWLVEHRFRGTLACHHCGHTVKRPDSCPACGSFDSLVACGPGVERIAEEITARFPERRTVILSSDMTGGPERLRRELAAVTQGECDIIIGTQLVAKGHTFPKLTLVGVVDADIGLSHGDPRAAERTFQLMAQVTGRAGRIQGQGRGVIQTFHPHHPVMEALVSGDADRFYAAETADREMAGMPPFGRLVALIIAGEDRAGTEGVARMLAQCAGPLPEGVDVLGPAEAALSVVRGRHRFRLLMQAPRNTHVQGLVRAWLGRAGKIPGSVKVSVDVDPQSFL